MRNLFNSSLTWTKHRPSNQGGSTIRRSETEEADEDISETRLKLVVRTFQEELVGAQAALNERSEELITVQQELRQARDEIGQFKRQEELDRQTEQREAMAMQELQPS